MQEYKIFRGRLIDHVHLVVADLEASKRFYRAALGALGRELSGEGDSWFSADELFVSTADSRAAAGQLTGRIHLAFSTRDKATVDRFHAAVLEAGGRDNGAPGPRPYHPGYYGAFALDPDGNNIEAVYHGEAHYSADAVEITFQA